MFTSSSPLCPAPRSEFEGLLEKSPSEANAFLADPEKYIAAIRANPDAAAREQVEKVVDLLVTNRWEFFFGNEWPGGEAVRARAGSGGTCWSPTGGRQGHAP